MDLDNIKKVWATQKTASFSREEILAMLQKKSSSVAKWIFYISLAEFAFWLGIMFFSPQQETQLDTTTIGLINGITYLNYAVCLAFIILFFRNYQKIKATQPVNRLLKNIFNVRKTVQFYIMYNISTILFGLIAGILSLIIHNDDIMKIPENTDYPILWGAGLFFGTVLFLGVIFAILYFFYKLLYGLLLKRLTRNYNEIKELQ